MPRKNKSAAVCLLPAVSTFKARDDIHLRWLVQRDMDAVVRIEQLCFGDDQSCSDDGPWSGKTITDMLQQKNIIGMVAEWKDQVVGYVVYGRDGLDAGLVRRRRFPQDTFHERCPVHQQHITRGGRRETGGCRIVLHADSRQRGAATFPGCKLLPGLCRRWNPVLLRETFRNRRISRNPL